MLFTSIILPNTHARPHLHRPVLPVFRRQHSTTDSSGWLEMRTAVILGVIICVLFVVVNENQMAEPMRNLLRPIISGQDSEQTLVATALLDNYLEQRRTAAFWSCLYWGFAWLSALLSALAGFVLKLESAFADEKIKKDLAAGLAMAAALLITISTSGDFQRKWQATRGAATDLEKATYEFVKNNGKDARNYLGIIGAVLYKRNQAILATGEHPVRSPDETAPNAKDR